MDTSNPAVRLLRCLIARPDADHPDHLLPLNPHTYLRTGQHRYPKPLIDAVRNPGREIGRVKTAHRLRTLHTCDRILIRLNASGPTLTTPGPNGPTAAG